MRFVRKLLGFALLAASIVIVRGRRRALSAALGVDVRPATPPEEEVQFDDSVGTSIPVRENLVDIATQSGIADVDPGPLSHVAGEGIDLERDVAAQESVKDQRDRLPR